MSNYTLMHKDIMVADITIDDETAAISAITNIHNIDHTPVGISVGNGSIDRGALNKWWTGRAIPASRMGLSDALLILGIHDASELLTKAFGLSLSDQYWVRPSHEYLTWQDVNFFDNDFSDDIGDVLFGEQRDSDAISLFSPDNTSDGWLKKKWKIMDGTRCLLKSGSGTVQQEPYNEVVASLICSNLHIDHIPYRLTMVGENPFSVCDNFITKETELISAWTVMQVAKKPNHHSVYQHYLTCCETLGIPNVEQAVNQMIVLDYLVGNEDRHLNNFGVIRNADTLEYLGAAPIFDTGSSLGFRFINSRIKAPIPCKPFKTSHQEQIKLVTDFSWVDFGVLRNLVAPFMAIFQDSEFVEPARAKAIYDAYLDRVDSLERQATQTHSNIFTTDFDVEENQSYQGEELELD